MLLISVESSEQARRSKSRSSPPHQGPNVGLDNRRQLRSWNRIFAHHCADCSPYLDSPIGLENLSGNFTTSGLVPTIGITQEGEA